MTNILQKFIPGVPQAQLIAYAISGGLIVAFIWWIWWMMDELGDRKEKISMLSSNVEVLTENTDVLRQNYLQCQTANTTNNDTIESLLKERNDAQEALKRLTAQKMRDNIYIDQLEARVGIARNNPSQNGPLAPVLRDTIKDIQERANNE